MACGCDGRKRTTMVRPTWADPMYMLATNTSEFTVIPTLVGGLSLVARNNPKRWAIGFVSQTPVVGTMLVAPHNQAQDFGQLIGTNGAILWYDIFRYGPMVSYEWYVFSSGGDTLGLYEVETY